MSELSLEQNGFYDVHVSGCLELTCVCLPIPQEEEFYVCIYATREGDYVLFHHEGGVDVGDVDAKASKLLVGVDEKLTEDAVKKQLLTHVAADIKE